MSSRVQFAAERWWRGRFHPVTRVGWYAATAGRSRPPIQAVIGLGFVALGFMLKRGSQRTVLYRGTIEPGGSTRIKVYRGQQHVLDETVRG